MKELRVNSNLVYVSQICEELVTSVMLYSTKTTQTRAYHFLKYTIDNIFLNNVEW